MALTFCVFPSNQHPLGSSCILSGKEACGKISATCTVLEQRICHRVLGGFRSHLSSAALGKWKLSFLNRIALEDFSGSLPYQGNHSVGVQKAPPGFWNKSTCQERCPFSASLLFGDRATARNQPRGHLGGRTQPVCEQCHRDAPDTGKKSSKGPWLPLHGGALLCH